MKVKIKAWYGETFGIELTAENRQEEEILSRFFKGGVKVNVYTSRPTGSSLQLTFMDLIDKKADA